MVMHARTHTHYRKALVPMSVFNLGIQTKSYRTRRSKLNGFSYRSKQIRWLVTGKCLVSDSTYRKDATISESGIEQVKRGDPVTTLAEKS